MATNEQMKTEFSFFGEVWTLFKKYYEVQDSDSYWDSLIAEADAVAKKYQNNKLCCDLILAVMSALERKSKEIQKMQ